MMWSIDDKEWTIPCTVKRTAEMAASDISGLLLDGTYFNDVIGTYMNYDIEIAVPNGMESEYHELYDVITDPVGYHTFTLPYNGTYIEVTGRIEDISDIYVRLPNNQRKWRGISFDILASAPTKTYTLDELIVMGMPPLPDESEAQIGDAYEFTASGWVELDDAEGNYF